MNKGKRLIYLGIICCIGFSRCKNASTNKLTITDPVYSTVVLQVGDLKLTQYEFEKNYNIFKSVYRQQHQNVPDSGAVKNWINEYIDNQYLLADAYAKGYDKDSFVVKRTESMARFMVSQPKGLLDQELVSGTKNDNFTSQNKQEALNVKLAEEKKLLNKHNNDILREAKVKINRVNLYSFANMLKPYKDLHIFQKSNFRPIVNTTLLLYKYDGENKLITVGNFMDYYNLLPARYPIESAETIRYYLEGMVIDDYDYKEAKDLGITEKPQFLLDKKNYANSLISKRYADKQLKYDTVIAVDELQALYNKQKNKYTAPAVMTASIYYFDIRKDAFNVLVGLSRKDKGIQFQPANVQDFKKHIKVTSNTNIADTIKNALYNLKIDQVSRPITLSSGYAIAIKETATGQRYKTLSEVKPVLTQQILNERLNLKQKQVVAQLKKIFRLNNHINYNKYYN